MKGQENRSGDEPSLPPGAEVSGTAPRPDRGATAPGAPAAASNLRQRMADQLHRGAAAGESFGGHAAAELGHGAAAMALEIVPTALGGERALVGHVLGMHLALPAGHLHGPRQAPALLYLFADALAVRPTDDAPMSTVPMFGLHMVLPPLAIARWLYKAGRIEHANVDLVKDAARFAESLAEWTVDDFADADPKLVVHRAAGMPGPLRVYEHLGFAHISVPVTGDRPAHLKSSLPASSEAFVKLWQLFARVGWPQGLRMDPPAEAHEDAPADPPGGDAGGH